MVTAFAVLSPLTSRLLAFFRDTFVFTDLCMSTAASQSRERQTSVRFHTVNAVSGHLHCNENVCEITVKQETSVRHVCVHQKNHCVLALEES